MSNPTLLPCPFCGSSEICYIEELLVYECQSCATEGPFPGLRVGTQPKRRSKKLWNKRASVSIPSIPSIAVNPSVSPDPRDQVILELAKRVQWACNNMKTKGSGNGIVVTNKGCIGWYTWFKDALDMAILSLPNKPESEASK